MLNILKEYLQKIQTISPSDKEHSNRGALESLFKSLAEVFSQNKKSKIHITHEPNNDSEGKGAPDFLITLDSLVVGYIENKRVGANLDEIAQSDQIKKYFSLSPNLMLTDYLRFILLRQDDKGKISITQEVQICPLSSIKSKPTEQKAQELYSLFEIFFSHTPKPINTPEEFADSLASRTRLVRDSLLTQRSHPKIQSLYEIFKSTLYAQLSYHDFCDSFAQTLTYSLFLSKLNSESNEITLSNIDDYIPQSFPLIKELSRFLKDLRGLKEIQWLLQEIINIINHINISSIITQLNSTKTTSQALSKDPYLHFYETFLSKYDPKVKELRGVYYTPQSVVDFIINSVDEILKNEFKVKEGLSSATKSTKPITLLDFATGTGTFLLQAFRKALEGIDKKSMHYNPSNLIKNFYGFEYLIAPYTIAHLKLSQSLIEEFGHELEENERLQIYLTNTLENINLDEEKNKFSYFQELVSESQQAQLTKEKPIFVITGNPPYNGRSTNQYDKVKDYYYCEVDDEGNPKSINEKNPKWIQDDYVKFIRFAQDKIDKEPQGIIAIITNHGFLDNITFRGMRWSLLNSFDKIYLLDLHGNIKKKEKAPDGSKDENVFDIKQGVSISLFIKTKPKSTPTNSPQTQVYHYDLFGIRSFKYDFLSSNSLNTIAWNQINPSSPHYLFTPQDEELEKEYNKGVSVKDIFMFNGVGICSKRDHIVFHNTEEKILQLLQDFSTKPKDKLYQLYDIGEDSRDWKLDSAITSIQKNLRDFTPYVRQCNYRPFDSRWTYYISESKAFMAYPVYDIFEHFIDKENLGLVSYRCCGVNGLDNVFIADSLIDLHLVGSGSQIFPLYLYPTERSKKFLAKYFKSLGGLFEGLEEDPFEGKEKVENLTPSFREFIDDHYSCHFTPEEILGYIYAILFHKTYRTKYFQSLKKDFPKIPFSCSKDTFLALSTLGQSLYTLHLLQDEDLPSVGEPKLLDRKIQNTTIDKPKYNQNKLFVNSNLYFDEVSSEVWEYTIGGYQVLDKYLKSHKGEEIDYEYFQKIIAILHKSLEIEKEISQIDTGV